MPRDKTESHIRVMAAAREEFMEYGFEGASMRRVGERAGLTAAGVYRHCRDKADLFDQLVASAVEDLTAWFSDHVAKSNAALEHNSERLWDDTWVKVMRECIYPRKEEYRLLLTKAQGTKYESFLHDLVSDNQGHMMAALETLKSYGYSVREISENELHLLLSAYVTALFEPVIHDYPMEDALRCLETTEAFFIPGWKALMGF